MPEQPKKEFFNLFAWIGKKKTKIGYAFRTDRGTLRLKAEPHFDAMKLGRALISGIEIEKRQPLQQTATPEQDCPSLADQYNAW